MYEYEAEVIRVIDADTIELSIDLGFHTHRVEKVRIHNYDAPEVRKYEGVTDEEKKKGLAAKAYAETILSIGSMINVNTHYDRTGKYGRFLVDALYKSKDGIWCDYAHHMIAQGYVKDG